MLHLFLVFLFFAIVVEAAAIAALQSSLQRVDARLRRVEAAGLGAAVAAPGIGRLQAKDAGRPVDTPEPMAAPQPVGAPRPVEAPQPIEGSRGETDSVPPLGAIADEPDPPVDAPPSEADEADRGGRAIDWERWLGVRGAAAVGAFVLVVALLYFLRYSIRAGWLTLSARVGLGAAASVAVVIASRLRLPKTHAVLASWMAGAGIAGIYASAWVGAWLAHLYGPVTAFFLSAGTTGFAVGLALVTSSLPIALLGFVGAFAAPLALISGSERPLAIVAYVLVVDVGAIFLSMRRRWWSLSLLAVVVSAGYEAVFVFAEGGTSLLPLHFGIAIAIASLFGIAPTRRARDEDAMPRGIARVVMYGALVASFGLAAPLAARLPVGVAGLPIAGLVVVLVGTAAALAHREEERGLAVLAAFAASGVLLVWGLEGELGRGATIAVAIGSVAVALPLVALVEKAARRGVDRAAVLPLVGALFASVFGGAVLGCVVAFRDPTSTLPVGVSLALLAGLLLWAARRTADDALASVALGGFASSMGVLAFAARASDASLLAGAVPSIGAAFVAWRLRDDEGRGRVGLAEAARAAAAIGLVTVALHANTLATASFATLVVVLSSVLVFTRPPGGDALALAVGPMTAGVLVMRAFSMAGREEASAVRAVGAIVASIVVLGPSLAAWLRGESGRARGPVAAAVALVAFAAVFIVAPGTLGEDASSTVTWTLLVVAAAAIFLVLVDVRRGDEAAVRRAARSLGVVAVGTAMGAAFAGRDREIAPLALAAIAGVATLALRAADVASSRGRTFSALVAATVCASVAGVASNPLALTFHARGGVPILNWTLWVFGAPAVVAVAVLARLGKAERSAAARHDGVPRSRILLAVAALASVFAWINVAVIDVFSAGTWLSLDGAASWSREGRDLAMSGAWAAFGVGLLWIGMKRGVGALRKASLGVVLLTMAKVFLYDLGALEDLHRVAALVALAVSLIGVSVLYQRFVFRGRGR